MNDGFSSNHVFAMMMRLQLWPALVAWALLGVAAEKREMEVTENKGYAAGQSGEYFRYKHLFYKKPTEEDFESAQKVAQEVRCAVCAQILKSLLGRARSYSEDDIADVIEGHVEYERTGDAVEDQMLKHKKGCNKHFKDDLVAEGFMLRPCKEVAPEIKNDTSPCLWQNTEKPSKQSVDTYEVWKEGVFYACEQSIAYHADVLTEALAERLRGVRDVNLTEVAEEACRTSAKCASSRKPKASETSSKPASKPAPKKKGKGSKKEL
ncbi:Hypothetical protein (Fragment) [Durusdinium trenchii]|uniref:Uncharacterized protein n=2 Tax=Durusdinium trenchii TaxID=1381693 RepID=A0ABP0HHT7_9DINO